MMQRTANENAAYKRRICKRSDQPKIDRITNKARLILREKLNGATTVDSFFDLVGSRQHGVASYEIFSWSADIHILTKMVMTSDETQMPNPCQLANVTCKTRDKGQLEKSRLSFL